MFGISRQVFDRSIKVQEINIETANKVIDIVREVRLRQHRVATRKLYVMCPDAFKYLKIDSDRLFKILKANHLLIKSKHQYHVITNSHHRFHKHKNRGEDLSIVPPEQVWVADIIYKGERSNPMYLALLTDAYSKKIMGYHA